MTVLGVVLYILAAFFIIVVLFCFSLLFIPIRYKVEGGYEEFLWLNFIVQCPPILGMRGKWSSAQGKNPLQLRLTLVGISFSINPEKWGEKEKKEEEKEGKSMPFFTVLRCLDRELMGNMRRLLGDLLRILRPHQLELTGKVGFSEPHLSGWLTGLQYMLKGYEGNIKVDIEPVWEEEYYKVNFTIGGRVPVFLMIIRLVRFILTWHNLKFLIKLKKEKAALVQP